MSIVEGEYQSNMKYYLRLENKVDENKVLSYCEPLRYMLKHNHNNEKVVLHYIKHTNSLSFQIKFPQNGPTYRRQVVNPRHQTLQGQSVAKSGAPL